MALGTTLQGSSSDRVLQKSFYSMPSASPFFLCFQEKHHKRKTAAAVLPVRVGDEGVALESSFKDGIKNEVLRSLCQLVNSSQLALEVSLLPLQAWLDQLGYDDTPPRGRQAQPAFSGCIAGQFTLLNLFQPSGCPRMRSLVATLTDSVATLVLLSIALQTRSKTLIHCRYCNHASHHPVEGSH